MKKLFSLKALFVIVIFYNSSFCQQNIDDRQVIQLGTGKDKITFYILDCETNEPLIGAIIYSFNINKDEILAETDLDGIAITEKGLSGNLEISYVGYYPTCFKLISDSIDSIVVKLKTDLNIGCGLPVRDEATIINTDSLIKAVENKAQLDLSQGDIHLITKVPPSEEQILLANIYSFSFVIWDGISSYRERVTIKSFLII